MHPLRESAKQSQEVATGIPVLQIRAMKLKRSSGFCTLIQEAVIKTISKKKKCKKAKWLSEEGLQIAVKRREAKDKGEKGKIYPTECRVPNNRKER